MTMSSSPPLAPELTTLFESARAEAKRAGHQIVTTLHLAAALARRDEASFEAVFGVGSVSAVGRRLAAGAPEGADAETTGFLASLETTDRSSILRALRERLGDIEGEGSDTDEDGTFARSGRPLRGRLAQHEIARGDRSGGGLLVGVSPDASVAGFDDTVNTLIALLARRTPAYPLLVGPPGSGKSTAIVALATKLADHMYTGPLAGTPVVRVATERVLGDNPVAMFHRALDSQAAGAILVIDDLEALLGLGSSQPYTPLVTRLRSALADDGKRILLVIDDGYVSRLEARDAELVAELTLVNVERLSVLVLREIAESAARDLAAHHAVAIPDEVVLLAAAPSGANDRNAHPGLLIERLDQAATRAAMRKSSTAVDDDLGLGASPEVAPLDAAALENTLRQRVRGQDPAVRRVASRLALTRAQLDLRPERPDGVFLFVGPTGVGKTELARAVCSALFRDEDRLIRLDMSEYAEPWSLARLIGPQPGLVGFTEPESWLTTRIRRQPDTVLLLDEIEKANSAIWSAFLQVFDAGRLSDARGEVADFSRTVIAMTSNLGASAFGSAPLGFAQPSDETTIAVQDERRVLEAIRRVMPPELINRLDEIVIFHPLDRAVIEDIARAEIDRLCGRLEERGYQVEVTDDAINLVIAEGYDPAYGARHLHRNIERLLLQPLAAATTRRLRAVRDADAIRWVVRD